MTNKKSAARKDAALFLFFLGLTSRFQAICSHHQVFSVPVCSPAQSAIEW